MVILNCALCGQPPIWIEWPEDRWTLKCEFFAGNGVLDHWLQTSGWENKNDTIRQWNDMQKMYTGFAADTTVEPAHFN